jgi:uncharacterized protein (DUF1697 family)
MTYIALLRGINVGGHKIIPMAKLKTIFESAKFKNVVTYIQSGNVLFDSAAKTSDLVRIKVEKILQQKATTRNWGTVNALLKLGMEE